MGFQNKVVEQNSKMWFVISKFSCEGELRESVYLIMAKTNISDLSHVHVGILRRDRITVVL